MTLRQQHIDSYRGMDQVTALLTIIGMDTPHICHGHAKHRIVYSV